MNWHEHIFRREKKNSELKKQITFVFAATLVVALPENVIYIYNSYEVILLCSLQSCAPNTIVRFLNYIWRTLNVFYVSRVFLKRLCTRARKTLEMEKREEMKFNEIKCALKSSQHLEEHTSYIFLLSKKRIIYHTQIYAVLLRII